MRALLLGLGLAACAPPSPPAAPAFEDVSAPAATAPMLLQAGPVFYVAAEAPPEPADRHTANDDAPRPSRVVPARRDAKHTSSGRPWSDATIIESVTGGLVQGDVLRAQQAVHAPIDGCTARMLRRHVEVQHGTSTFNIDIDARRTLRTITTARDDFQDAIYESCVGEKLRGAAWPAPTDSAGAQIKLSYFITAEAE